MMSKFQMFGVYLCGCTDCFLNALFVNETDAEDWGNMNSNNPEGFLVKEITDPSQIKKDLEL